MAERLTPETRAEGRKLQAEHKVGTHDASPFTAWLVEHADELLEAIECKASAEINMAAQLDSLKLTWSTERPTEEGHYAMKFPGNGLYSWACHRVAWAKGLLVVVLGSGPGGGDIPVASSEWDRVRWAGPIPEPTEPEEPT